MANYTTLEQLDTTAIAQRYGLTTPSFEVLTGGTANSSFRVRTDGGSYVLTILDNHDLASAQLLAQLTQSLQDKGFPTSVVVPDCHGDTVTTFNGRPALLKRFIDGHVAEVLPSDLLAAAGERLAALHLMPVDLPGLPEQTRRLSQRHQAKLEIFSDRDFAGWLEDRLRRLHPLVTAQSSVMIHGDLYPDNVIIRPDRSLALIDWETASLDDPLLDLGMTIVGLGCVTGVLVPQRAADIVAGYARLRPLSTAERELLTSMTEYAALIIAFHRFYRHNLSRPDAQHADRYKEIMGLVASLDRLAL